MHVLVKFRINAMYACTPRVACGSEDVTQNKQACFKAFIFKYMFHELSSGLLQTATSARLVLCNAQETNEYRYVSINCVIYMRIYTYIY